MLNTITWIRSNGLPLSKLCLKSVCNPSGGREYSSLASRFKNTYVYIMNALGEISQAFQYGTVTCKSHEKSIRDLLEDVPEGRRAIKVASEPLRIINKSILVVDDEPVIRKIISETLDDVGAITTAADGLEALTILQKNFFKVIISDIDMPKMNGIELYRKAVELNSNLKRQFIFVSGDISPETTFFLKVNHLLYHEIRVFISRFDYLRFCINLILNGPRTHQPASI